jgi:alanyl-tRNA synthetase
MYIMSTELAYYDDIYRKEWEAEVLDVREIGNRQEVFLDSTIFYPHGGGQPADTGSIEGPNGLFQVSDVKYRDLVVHHIGTLEGQLEPEDRVMCKIDWDRRYWNMRVHSAGHFVHDVLMELTSDLVPTKADHGSKPFLEYRGELRDLTAEQLEERVNAIIQENRPVHTGETTFAELKEIAEFVPPNLPKNKPLRFLQIEGYSAMPDGGTHVRKISEIGKVEVTAITVKGGNTIVRYRVLNVD